MQSRRIITTLVMSLFIAGVIALAARPLRLRQQSLASSTPAAVVIPTSIATVSIATKPAAPVPATRPLRIYIDSNVTPVFFPNDQWRDDGKGTSPDAAGVHKWRRNLDGHANFIALGFRPAAVCYVGTLNRAPIWSDDQGNPRPLKIANGPAEGGYGGLGFDWTRQGSFADPPVERAVKAVAKVAMDPTIYGDNDMPFRPIFFDIEGAATINLPAEASNADKRKAIRHLIDCAKWARQATNNTVQVGFYGFPPFSQYWKNIDGIEPEILELRRNIQFVTANLYNWDTPAATKGESWFDDVADARSWILRECPEFDANKIAFISPYWTITFPQNAKPGILAMDGKPVPIELWERQIKYLAANGWDVFFWTGGGKWSEYGPHAQALARLKDQLNK